VREQPTLEVVEEVVAHLVLLLAEMVVLELLLFVGRNCADKYSINLRVLNV
jgi:hypothetical protein